MKYLRKELDMRKYIVLILVLFILNGVFSQSTSKVVPFKDKKRDYFYYMTSFPVNNNNILTFFAFKDVISLKLYDSNLKEIANKEIERQSKGDYNLDFYISKKYFFIHEKVKKENVYKIVTLDDKLTTKSFAKFGNPNFYVDADEENCYYSNSKGFEKYNFETKESLSFEIPDGKVTEYATFPDNHMLVTKITKGSKNNSTHWITVYDKNTTKEIQSFNRYSNDKYKYSTYFKNVVDYIYVVGNYKENPDKTEMFSEEYHSDKPSYTGVYINKIGGEQQFEKFYKYSDFKNLSNQIIQDKREKHLKVYRFCLEDIEELPNETVIIATISKDAFENAHDILDDTYNSAYTGQELNYVLVFGIDKKGGLLWDKVISLDWKNQPKPTLNTFFKSNNFPSVVNCDKNGEKLECHYAFKQNINYFEIFNDNISNTKTTPFELKENHKQDLVEFQYEESIYWYENFYFNHDNLGFDDGYILDKIQFHK